MKPLTCVKCTLSGPGAAVIKLMFLHEGETAEDLRSQILCLVMALTLPSHCELGQIVLCFSTLSVLCDGLVISLLTLSFKLR